VTSSIHRLKPNIRYFFASLTVKIVEIASDQSLSVVNSLISKNPVCLKFVSINPVCHEIPHQSDLPFEEACTLTFNGISAEWGAAIFIKHDREEGLRAILEKLNCE
jgi:hypothetical protein